MSSIAHPVTASDPVMFAWPSVGVSISPTAGVLAPGRIVRLTAAVTLPAAPVVAIVTTPFSAPAAGMPKPSLNTLTVSVAGPDPDAGDTDIHGGLAVAVHVTEPGPLCVRATAWDGVCTVQIRGPALTAPKFTVDSDRAIVGFPLTVVS